MLHEIIDNNFHVGEPLFENNDICIMLQAELYILKSISNKNIFYVNTSQETDCKTLKYIVRPINHTNMLLIVIDLSECKMWNSQTFSVEPEEIFYGENDTLACRKSRSNLSRRRPETCIRTHPKESEIKNLCGSATNLVFLRVLLFFPMMIIVWCHAHLDEIKLFKF